MTGEYTDGELARSSSIHKEARRLRRRDNASQCCVDALSRRALEVPGRAIVFTRFEPSPVQGQRPG